jgi:hypothetical protein
MSHVMTKLECIIAASKDRHIHRMCQKDRGSSKFENKTTGKLRHQELCKSDTRVVHQTGKKVDLWADVTQCTGRW